MAKMYIMGAGHSFHIGDSAYAKLISFADKVSLLGIKFRISPKTYDSTISLFTRCSYASKSGDYIVIVDEMQHPHGDVGKEMLCEWFAKELENNEQAAQSIAEHRQQDSTLPEAQERLAMLPEDSTLIENPVGMEPGYMLAMQDKHFFFLPHQPEALFRMLDESVLPILANLSGKEMATASATVTGLEASTAKARLSKLLKKERAQIYFECAAQENTVEIALLAFANGSGEAEALVSRCMELVTEHFWPNIMDKNGGTAANALPETLRDKKLLLAAAVTGKELSKGIAALLPDVFRYLFNAELPAVREMVLEVPRTYLHENGGINRDAAMCMARNVTAICEAEAGFALIMEPERLQAVMAFYVSGRLTAREFTLPDGLNGHEEIKYACRCATRFCTAALEAYPEDMPDSVPVSGFLNNEDSQISVFSLLWPNRRKTG